MLGRHDGRVRPPDRVFARSCDGLWLDRRVYADREAGLLDGTVATCAVTGAASKHVVGLATAAECPLLGQMEDPTGFYGCQSETDLGVVVPGWPICLT